MLKGFVEQYLLRYLGDYIFGVDKQNLSVTTWRGEIHLRSARLKQEVVELLNLPFKLIFGEAADLKINVPWNRLGSRPVVVELTGLRVLLGPKPATEWSNEEELRRVQLARQRLVDRADLLFGLEASPDDRKEGYLGRLVTRISDNLELQLRDLHIRFQDDSPAAGGPPVSGGLHLASLEVQSTGSDWQPSFIERSDRSELFKLLQLRNLSCYHEPPGWAARSDEGTDEAIRRCFLDWPKEIQLKQGRIVYLLPPCSGQLKLTQALDVSEKSEEPRFDLQCELEPIKVLISSASYRGVCGTMSLVSEYFAFQEVTRHWIQSYWPYRPVVHVHGNSLLWWRYAFRCIRAAKSNVRAPAKARFIQLLTEENLSRLRLQAEYCTLVVKSRSVQLLEHEQARLQRLRVSLPATELLRCHAMALERLQAQGEASADPGRWSFWGRTKVLSVPSSPSLVALEAPAVEDENLEQSGHSGPCEVQREDEREDLAFKIFKYKPSVGSWLMPRPCRIWDAEAEGFDEELDMPAEGAQDHEVDEVAEVEGESSRAPIALCEAKETEAFPQDDFRFMPSVGTWLHPRYEENPPQEIRKRPEPEPEKSWLAWLLPSRFGEREVSQRDTSQRQSAQAESSSWLSWRRKPRPEPPPAVAVPAVPAVPAPEKAQSSWFPSFRWFSEQPEEKEASVQEESSSGETPKPTSPVQAVPSTSPSNNPPAWRVWFSPASGTDPPAAAQPSPHPVEGQQPRPVAFTKVVAPIDEVPLLRLALELPEVNVEIQTQKHVKTIGFAKSLRLKLLAGDELNTKAEVADLQLLVRSSRHKTPVDTYLLHSGHLEKVMSVEYISRDSEGQPVISIKAQNLVLFYQQELFQQVTNFLAADFTVGKPRRGFDRWRRRAKALLYTRGRPRCLLQLGDPTVLVPTRPWPAGAPRAGGGPVLALSARFVDAVSREVSDVEDEVKNFQLVRVDRWNVDCNGLQLLHFPSYRAFMTSRPSDWMLLQDTNIKLTCLAKRYEELLPPALLAFGVRQTPQALTSTEVEGEMQSLALNFNSVAYDSFIRAFRLLLRGPAGSSPPVVPPVNQVREPLREETFSMVVPVQETRPQFVYSFSSDEEVELASSTSNASEGSTVPAMKRTRFLSAESGLFMHLQSPTAEEPPTPFCALPEEGNKEPEGHKTMSVATKIGVVSLRFHCLSDATVELKASKAVVAFDLFQGYARIGLDMAELEMCSGTRCLVRADSESKAKVSLSLVAAWTAEAKLREAEAADLRISLDLRNGSFFFSPMYFREFISFAKTTPPGDVLKLPGDPLLWRIRVSLEKGLLHWVDEATNKIFAESKMKQSKILLDLHQDTVSFSSFFEDFSIQDCSSERRPMILAAQAGETYHMEIAARTFLSNSPEFRGYHTQVSISFRAVHLQYMGQKFMKCWQWVFGSFLPALTAGRRKGTVAAESSEEETSSSASFVSAEDGETREVPQESGEKFLAAKAASTTELFMELAEGDFAAGPAWEAAEKAVRQAESSQVPTLTRLHVSIDNVMVSIPLETGGKDKEPVVEIRARCIKASNGPCRRQGRIGLVDALALNFEQVSISEAGGVRMVAPQDMSVQIDLNLQVRDPPLPMHVLWRAPAYWELSSRSLALLRAAFSKNVAGIDLDLPQTTPSPAQLSKAKEFPVWLVFRLLFHNFKLRMQESEKTLAELGAKELIVEVKKHAAPRAVISFQVWEARLSSGLLPAPFNQLLCKRPAPKASALGRKGPSVYGAYTSDHSTGQEFQIHCNRPRVLLLLPLLRRCWAWMFPPKPWFSPPIILGERPSSQTEVRAGLQDAHVLLVDKFEEKEGPLISVLTHMQYQLESSPEMQKWCISFDNPEVFYTHGWPGVVDMEVKDSSKHRSLAKAKDMAFDVVTKTQSEGNTLGRRLSCQELRGNLSNCDLHVWIACVKRAWGITKELPEDEPNGQSSDSNGPENAKTAMEFDFRDVNVTLLSEHDCANPGLCPRFLKLRSSELFFSQSERLAGVERRIRAKLSLWLFNHIASDWEPLLEGQPLEPLDASEPRQYAIRAVCNSRSDATDEGPPTHSISIESADRLLVNVSELCWHVLPALSAPWLAPDRVMPPPLLSPYAVRNDLGMPISLHLPAHTKNGRARRVRLEPSSEQRLEAPHWTEESESKLRRHLATVELEGPRAVEVEGISLDCVGRRVYPLPAGMTRSSRSSSEQVLPGQAHQAVMAASRKGLTRATSHPELRRVEDAKGTRFLQTPYLVCRVQAKEAYKKIVLEPPARIINQMNVSVELKLSVNGKEILRTEVPPEGTAVPLDLRGAFVARPTMCRGLQWSREFLFEWLGSTQQAGDFRCASPGDKDAEGSFTFCIEWQTEFIPYHDLCAPQYTIRLCAPVTLVSALPVACKCEVRQVKSETGEIAWRQIRDLAALEKCEIHFVPVSLRLELRLAIFGDLWSDPLELKQEMDKVSIPVPVDGIAEHNTHFQAIVSWSALGKPLTVVVHSPTWIADHVCANHLGFAFQGKQGPAKDVFPVKGTKGTEGKPRMLPLDCRATHVGFKLFGQYCMSEAVSLAALSVTQMPLKAKRKEAHAAHEEMLLGLHFTERMEAGLGIRVLHVVPGQVAVNATGRKMSLRPALRSRADSSTERILELAPGDRIPVHWGNGQELFLQASISTDANGVEKHLNGHSYPRSHWSGRLPVGSVGEYAFQYATSSSLENFHVEVRSVDATKYFVFREAGNNTPILLKNLSSEPLLFQQDLPPSWFMEASEDNSDRQRWFSKSFTSSSHSTPEMQVHHRDRGLKLEPGQSMPFAWAEPAPEPPHQRKLEVRSCRAPLVARLVLEKTERSLPLPIASQTKLFYDVVTSGPSLVMTVRNEPRPEVAVRTSGGELHELQVKVNLAGLGFSLVAPTSCAFEAQDDGSVLRREMLYCSVDKVLGSFRRYDDIETAELTLQEVQVDNQRDDAMHPVLLKRRRKGKDDAAPLLRLEFSRFCDPQRPQLLNFDRLELGLRSIDLRLDQGFILDMMALVRDIRTSLGLAAAPDSDLGLEKEGLKIHFKHLKLDGAKVGVSFSSISGGATRDEAFWKRLLSSISSVDRAVIRFQEYTLQETTADAANFMTTLQGHYSKQFMKELMWFVGRLEVLGMPSSLCGSICWNCKEGVLCAPYKATSPQDFLEKCLVGIFDCGRNSFFECCNSTSKATGAASQGCRLCLPQDFRQPPGGPKTCSCFGSVQLGLRGLWTQPAKGYRLAGLRGCAKGTTQGVVGCLGGITLGCLDVTRETSASLRDAASRTDSDARLRPPRPLYGVARAIQPFDQRDAELKAQLVLLDPSLASMSLLECKRDDAGDLIAAATDAYFLYLCNGKLTKVRWEDIVEVEVSEKAICIQRATGKLCLEDDEQRCRIAAQLLGACLGADQ